MPKQSNKEHLTAIRDQIASMRIVKCRMVHERIVGPTLPTNLSEGDAPNHFMRVGLCDPDERNERLGCSHTMSRVRLDEALSQLKSRRAVILRSELNWLNNEIHLLDHRKGKAETTLAMANSSGSKQGPAWEELARLEQQHDDYVERIAVLRDEALLEIDKMIGRFRVI
ncbi:MAG TPA: hypothetical protein VJT71_19475 [Pyrinomonadaceae bacterium]|nr:hypothetical protein [Pyrinomonadaceae bacterium]